MSIEEYLLDAGQDLEMTDFEAKCYGMSTKDIRKQYMESITARYSGLEMVVMGILSDCQELLAYDHAAPVNAKASKERVRKQLNVAKYILSEVMESKDNS